MYRRLLNLNQNLDNIDNNPYHSRIKPKQRTISPNNASWLIGPSAHPPQQKRTAQPHISPPVGSPPLSLPDAMEEPDTKVKKTRTPVLPRPGRTMSNHQISPQIMRSIEAKAGFRDGRYAQGGRRDGVGGGRNSNERQLHRGRKKPKLNHHASIHHEARDHRPMQSERAWTEEDQDKKASNIAAKVNRKYGSDSERHLAELEKKWQWAHKNHQGTVEGKLNHDKNSSPRKKKMDKLCERVKKKGALVRKCRHVMTLKDCKESAKRGKEEGERQAAGCPEEEEDTAREESSRLKNKALHLGYTDISMDDDDDADDESCTDSEEGLCSSLSQSDWKIEIKHLPDPVQKNVREFIFRHRDLHPDMDPKSVPEEVWCAGSGMCTVGLYDPVEKKFVLLPPEHPEKEGERGWYYTSKDDEKGTVVLRLAATSQYRHADIDAKYTINTTLVYKRLPKTEEEEEDIHTGGRVCEDAYKTSHDEHSNFEDHLRNDTVLLPGISSGADNLVRLAKCS